MRRQSIDADDLFHGHIGAMDTCARGAARRRADDRGRRLRKAVGERYAGWQDAHGRDIIAGKVSLADLSAQVLQDDREVAPRSGRQERFENLARRYV